MSLLQGWPTALAAGVMLTLSLAVGRRLRAGWPAGPVFGFLTLVASTDLSLFLLRATGLPALLLPVLGVGGAVALIETIRLARPSGRDGPRSAASLTPGRHWLYWTLLGLLALNLHLVRTIWRGPTAGMAFVSAWNPLYVDASYAAGRFLRDTDMVLGRGFMSSTMYYAPNTLGLVALLRGMGIPDAHAAYNGATLLCVLLTSALLLSTLQRDRLAMLVYAALLGVYVISDERLVLAFAYGWSDEVLFLAGALVCSALFGVPPEDRAETRWCDAGLASTFLVFGRNYGLYFVLVILLLCTLRLWWESGAWRRLLAVAWALLLSFSAHEVWLVLSAGNVFYPRVRLPGIYPFTLSKLVFGTAVDWGIVALDWGVVASVGQLRPNPNGLWLVGLAVTLWARWADRRGRAIGVAWLLAPLLCLVLPLSLEVLTQYRKDWFSRLYMPSVWFPTWYPAFLLSRMPDARDVWQGPAVWLQGRAGKWGLAGCYALVVAAFVYHGAPGFHDFRYAKTVYATRLSGSSWGETDGGMAGAIQAALAPGEVESLRHARILYFHYEPGIGLRYYLGGNLFQDYDFWSDPVQSRIDDGTTLEGLLRALGGPNLYLSFGPRCTYQAYVAYPARDAIWRDLARLEELPYVRRVFHIGAPGEVAEFAEVDRERLRLPASGVEAVR